MTGDAPRNARSRRSRAELDRAIHAEVARTGTLDVAAITTAAGVSPATFYAHFATHDDALAAALDRSLSSIVDTGIREFHIEALLEHGLVAVVDRLVGQIHEAFRSEALVLRAALARLPQQRSIRDVYRRQQARGHEHFAHQIALGQAAGILGEGPSHLRATSLLVMLQGINNPLITGASLDPLIAADLRQAVGAVLVRT